MDIETMKMAAQIIQNLAASGKDAFVWWLMVEGVLPRVLNLAMILSALYAAYRVVKLICDRIALERSHDNAREEAYSTIKELGNLMQIQGTTYMTEDIVKLIKHHIIVAIGDYWMKKAQEEK